MIKMIIFGLGLAVVSTFGIQAQAITTVTSVSGASSAVIGVTPAATRIYGGIVKNYNTCTPMDNVNTCNTCDGVCAGVDKMCACNQTAIYPSLRLAIGFSSTDDLGGRVLLYQLSSETTPTAFSGTLAGGTKTFSLSQLWSFWCGKTSLLGTCDAVNGASLNITVGPSTVGSSVFDEAKKATLEIRIGVVDRIVAGQTYTECPSAAGAAGSGICYYTIDRGDEKVFVNITKDQRASDFPAASSVVADIQFTNLLFFFKATSDPTSIRNNDDAADLEISASGSDFTLQDRIKGLSNDTKYCFILGSSDQTGNVHPFQNPPAAGSARAKQICAIPSAVQGLLDDKKCFIATAAFGSQMDPHVDLLRQFRARFLMPTSWGTKFVKFYYENSSMWAQKIRHSEVSRTIVRGFLWPLVGFAALSLEFGMPMAVGLIFSVLAMLGLLIFWRKKRAITVLTKFSFFLILILLSGSFFFSSIAHAADDDFEEGGISSPPNPIPYVDSGADEFSEELNSPPASLPLNPQKVAEPAVIAAPMQEATVGSSHYKVPKKPQTQEGRELGHEKIAHPMAEKGLLSIEKDGSYYYEPSKFEVKNESISFRAGGILPPPNIVGPDGRTNYNAMYGGSPVQISVDYEWYPFVKWGKLGLQGGAGFFTSTGSGRFTYSSTSLTSACDSAVEDCAAREKYTFYGLPVSLGLIYRLQVTDRPYFAPYIVGGGSYYLLAEKRDDGKPFKAVGSGAGYGGGGIMFNISAFDRSTAFTLESEYGLHNVWINADYRYVASLSKVLDVSASLICVGMVMDY